MKIKAISILTAILGITYLGHASMCLEWDRIANWTGQGENAAAIGIQFNDGIADCIYVYGYRWDGDLAPTCREVMNAVCTNNNSLCLLEQRTSRAETGYHLGGIGFGAGNSALHSLRFDFEGALNDALIGFNYFALDPAGNLIGPGDAMTGMCGDAISEALDGSHVVRHPVDAATYGVASYDYDHWIVDGITSHLHWNAGWNIGNWVMWTGTNEISLMTYAGMGYASHRVKPGEFIVWNFNRHDNYPTDRDQVDGYSGATRPARILSYVPAEKTTEIREKERDIHEYTIYTLDGHKVGRISTPGLYVIKPAGMKSRLMYITRAKTQ